MRHSFRMMLLIGPERKARIKSYIEPALKGRPRRWAYVVPGPRRGAVRGITNSWEEARDAVARHIKAMYGDHEDKGPGRHHKPERFDPRHRRTAVMGAPVGPPRDYAMSLLSNFAASLRGLVPHAAVG